MVLATFTTPQQIGPHPQSVLWLLPLLAAIAVTYKATKISQITAKLFIREATVLFLSITAFIIITMLVLYAVVWLIAF
jgi:hypothetical protein